MGSKFFSEPRALLLKISLPTEGITKTVLVGFNATLVDVRQKLLSKLASFQIPTDINNWAFLLNKGIEQMWLDEKVSLKSYNIKDGDTLEFKRKVRLLGKISHTNLGPWVKAAPKTTAIYEHQLDRPVSPDPKSPPASPPPPERAKTATDKLFDELFQDTNANIPPRPATSLAATSSPFNNGKRRNSSSRRKSNTLVSLLTKSSAKSHSPKVPTSKSPTPKSPTKTKKSNSAESPITKILPFRTTPPAMAHPPSSTPSSTSTSPHQSTAPQPAAPKHKLEEITEEEMISWLEMDDMNKPESNSKTTTKQQHEIEPEITLSISPRKNYPIKGESTHELNHVNDLDTSSNLTESSLDEDEIDFQKQIEQLNSIIDGKSNPNTPRVDLQTEDGYVRQQVVKIEESEPVKETKKSGHARRRSRTGSDARLSMMIKRTTEMEQQFNTYIAVLTETIEKNEKTLDTVQDLLFQMIKRIDEGQMDVKGARRFAKKALDVILADAKQKDNE